MYMLAKVTSGVTLDNWAPLIPSFLFTKMGVIMLPHWAVIRIKLANIGKTPIPIHKMLAIPIVNFIILDERKPGMVGG